MSPAEPPTTPIPESLQRQLLEFRRMLWRRKVFEAAAAGLAGLLVSFLLVYGLDRVWVTPGWLRLVILLGGTSLFAVFAPYWLHRWIWGHRREAQLARLIAKKHPGLGDRLLGVIELRDQHESADVLSPRLRGAAIETVAAEAGRRKLADALPPRRGLRWALALMVLAGAAAAALALTPRAGLNALKRWLLPLSPTQRYTFTRLETPPDYLAVPYGEAFDVTLRLAGDTEQRPAMAAARYGQQPPVSAQLGNGAYRFDFPGQQESGTVVFRVGDSIHKTRVEPLQRPFVLESAALVTPPAYLRHEPQSLDLAGGIANAVSGSKIVIRLRASRELASGEFGPTKPLATDGETPPADLKTFAPAGGALQLNGNEATTPPLDVGAVSFEVPASWTDRHGLHGADNYRLRIDAVADMPPACYLQGIDRQVAILPEETVDLEMLTEDDFGIKAAGYEWSGEFSTPSPGEPAKGSAKLISDTPTQPRAAKPVAFSPKAFGIGPQKLTLRAYAEDYFPGRARVYSEPVVIFVLTRDQHRQILKSQFDRAVADLEDLARREENSLDETKRLDRLEGDDLQKEENLKRLTSQEQGEAESTLKMQELTERVEKLLKDAARNGEVDKETMRKMADSLKSMQELGSQDLPQTRQKMADSLEQNNTPEKTDKDVAEAKDRQQKAVDKMKEAVAKANDAGNRMEEGTFVARLKRAASEEDGISATLAAGFDLLGLSSSEIDPADARSLAGADGQQGKTASDVRWIQEDLGHYHARTSKPVFKEVHDAMREAKADTALDGLRGVINRNHRGFAAGATRDWAAKLTAWAARLDESIKKDDGGGGGGGGGGQEDKDFEFMLRVMKMIQKQQDLRAQTRALEQLRRTAEPPPATPDQAPVQP